jgi:myo-inositol-1(or 4)-monophosphatase
MTLAPRELAELAAAAGAIAAEAGAMLLAGLDRPKEISLKGEVDLVTDYDRRAEELITRRLTARFPSFPVIGEEGAPAATATDAPAWIVDPLDGTTNYSHGHPCFAVSIGLEHRGELLVGAISIPALGDLYAAHAGGGASCNGDPIRVSTTALLDRALVATGFPYDRRRVDDDNSRELVAFMKRSQGVRRCGAAAVDLALVARGIYDGFWEPRLHAWDLAAGVVLVREAGGTATDYEGGDPDIRSGWIVASNGALHQRLLEVIAAARAEL